MNPSDRYAINHAMIAHETIDGEVIIITFDTGNYYSMDKAATDVWSLIEKNATVSEIIRVLQKRYDADRDELTQAVHRLISDLLQEEIVVLKESENVPAGSAMEATVGQVACSDKVPFESPILHKYTDMRDLLIIDPIHEVDEAGWPTPKPSRTTSKDKK